MSSQATFSDFFRAHYPAVLAYARRRTREEAARDVAAEVFAIAWRRWSVAEARGLPWLFRTASLVLKNMARAERRQESGVAVDCEPTVDLAIDDLHIRDCWRSPVVR